MPRESVKHGPERDEGLRDEARRHRGEFEEGMATDATASAPGDPGEVLAEAAEADQLPGEPLPPAVGARPAPLSDPEVSGGETALRRELLERVRDAAYPATRNDLLRHVGADERSPLHGHLRALPPDLVFSSPEEVVTAFGGMGDVE